MLSLSLSFSWRESVEDRRFLRLVLRVSLTVGLPSDIELVVICWAVVLCVDTKLRPESPVPGLSVTDLRSWKRKCRSVNDCVK